MSQTNAFESAHVAAAQILAAAIDKGIIVQVPVFREINLTRPAAERSNEQTALSIAEVFRIILAAVRQGSASQARALTALQHDASIVAVRN